jgi:oxepin-CoA hydrolase / 3-oxo-5,6-dehydrosuberyl-CoA semialdehyde dehydrogenase
MTTTSLQNYAHGFWATSKKDGEILHHAITGEALYNANSEGLDFGEMMHYARKVGGRGLRKLTFHERGNMLKALAMYLLERKEYFYTISAETGATRADSWVDIEGGIGNLFANASLRRQFPNERFCTDGEAVNLSKNGTFIGQHILVPREGVAIHINAFNFPVWGMLEKIAVNLLAGVPAIVKPATLTSFLTEAVVRSIIKSKILPEGSLQLICGSARGILEHVESQDVVTFTGSATTGIMLKSTPRVIAQSVPFNMEADSLNCCVLGSDVTPEMPEFDLFIKEIHREMTTKAGQKCTAVRRIFVPENRVEAVQAALQKRIETTIIGNPAVEGVRMGSLAGKSQQTEVREKVLQLAEYQDIIIGNLDHFEVRGADKTKGAFFAPMVFLNTRPFEKTAVHDIEAFGPVATIMPYKDLDDAIELAKMGKGSLVCSIVTADDTIARDFVLGAACLHGRILVLNADCAKESTGHGSPLPLLVHGGPGRAGGGEEMGGLRGVKHYLQRTAIQGSPTTISKITNIYQAGAQQVEYDKHPFQKFFDELEIGETYTTHKHTVTEADIVNFANVSGDHFYAHVDETSLEGTLFEGRVAHGYYILSKAAGMFVHPKKGPVLLNYGIEEARFTKPVYPGTTIGVRITVKEKVLQDQRDENDIPKGIVKWRVEVYDQLNETVAVATILTMVKRKI